MDTTYGSHVMYFVSSYIGWRETVLNVLLDGLYSEAYTKLTADHPVTYDMDVVNAINW